MARYRYDELSAKPFRTGGGSRNGRSFKDLKSWQTRFFLSIFTLGGLLFSGVGAWNTWEMSRQLAAAQETTGLVRSATVRTETSRDAETRRTTTHYVPVIEYQYEVNGKTFTSDRLYPGGMLIRGPGEKSSASAQRIVREHTPGTVVEVWYLPDEPETAFLKPIRRLDNGIFALVGAMLAAAGAGLLLPSLVPARSARLFCAAVLFLAAQALSWMLWRAYLVAPREQLSGSPRLLQWLLIAYVLICWAAVIAHAPPRLEKLREATFASLTFGTVAMAMSLFVVVPLMAVAPALEPIRVLPWIGVVTALLILVLSLCGYVTSGDAANSPAPE